MKCCGSKNVQEILNGAGKIMAIYCLACRRTTLIKDNDLRVINKNEKKDKPVEKEDIFSDKGTISGQMETGVSFDSRRLYQYLHKYCSGVTPYDNGDEYGVSVPVSDKIEPICEFLKVFVDGMKYDNLSADDVDFADFYYEAFSIWKDVLGEKKANELQDEMNRFHHKLWNEERI